MEAGAINNPVRVGSRIVNNPTTVVLIGDRRTGKSSLIKRGEKGEKFVPGPIKHILPNCLLGDRVGLYPEPIVALDTSPGNQKDMDAKLHKADVVILTYSCEDPQSFISLEKNWIPKLENEKLRSTVKVIVVGCMVELKSKTEKFWEDFEIVCEDMLLKYPILEAFVECSAHQNRNIQVVFRFAARAVLYPLGPLLSRKTRNLSPRFVRALKRIFSESVEEKDSKELLEHENTCMMSFITEHEYNQYIQGKMLGAPPLKPAEFKEMKRTIQDYLPGGVVRDRITMRGFIFLHSLFVKRGCYENAWALLTGYGYSFKLRQRSDRHHGLSQCNQDLELTLKTKLFLKKFFGHFKPNEMGVLSAPNAEHLFSTELKGSVLFDEVMFDSSASSSVSSLDEFVRMFDLMARQKPPETYAALIDLGFLGSFDSAFCTRGTQRLEAMDEDTNLV